jgi:transformer-2 protein
VSNLSRNVRGEDLDELFAKCGKVSNLEIIKDPEGVSRGFGFVTMETVSEAKLAIEKIDKTDLERKIITVQMSKRSRAHKSTPGAYLGQGLKKRRSPHKRRYRSRSRSRSRSRNHHRRRK